MLYICCKQCAKDPISSGRFNKFSEAYIVLCLSFTSHIHDDQMRRMVNLLADEQISRGHALIDHSILTQLFESFKLELARISEKIDSFEHCQSSMLHHLISEMKGISTRLFMIETFEREEFNSIKERLEDNIQKLESLSSGDSKTSALLVLLE